MVDDLSEQSPSLQKAAQCTNLNFLNNKSVLVFWISEPTLSVFMKYTSFPDPHPLLFFGHTPFYGSRHTCLAVLRGPYRGPGTEPDWQHAMYTPCLMNLVLAVILVPYPLTTSLAAGPIFLRN